MQLTNKIRAPRLIITMCILRADGEVNCEQRVFFATTWRFVCVWEDSNEKPRGLGKRLGIFWRLPPTRLSVRELGTGKKEFATERSISRVIYQQGGLEPGAAAENALPTPDRFGRPARRTLAKDARRKSTHLCRLLEGRQRRC